MPSWIVWNEKSGSFTMGSEEPEICLENKKTSVILDGKEIWRSDNGVKVSDLLVYDIDHDGKNELILLFFRRGSFKSHHPFWMEDEDRSWSEHIGVYDWKEDYAYRLDPIWVTSALGIDITGFYEDEDGALRVMSKEGEETRWYWSSFGLEMLEGDEKPFSREESIKRQEEKRKEKQEGEHRLITFSASGDNLIHEPIFKAAKEDGGDGYDFSYAYSEVSDFFKEHDLNLINMESLVTDELEPSDYPFFSAPGEDALALYDCNFRLFNLSNNHIYDKGLEGLILTEAFWEKMPSDTAHFGLYNKENPENICIYDYDGIKIGLLGYTYGTNLSLSETGDEGESVEAGAKEVRDEGIPEDKEEESSGELTETQESCSDGAPGVGKNKEVILLEEGELIKEQLKAARERADIVIVSCHFGTENSHTVTDAQRSIAKTLSEWGADLVIGTHPHVIQDARWFNTKDGRRTLCCYSLGNFISSMKKCGQLLGLTLECVFDCRMSEAPGGGVDSAEIKSARLIPNVTVYGPYYKRPHVRWLSDYTKEEALSNKNAYRDPEYSYEKLWEIYYENVSEEFRIEGPADPEK